MLLVGVILLFVFVGIAIIKSESADAQHKKTKGQILIKALQSFVIFLLIPFLILAGIMLTNAIMGAINGSMAGAMIDGNGNTLIGGQILVTSGHGAYIGDASARAEIERMFVTGQLDYNNLDVVKKYYNLGDMNFFVGIAGGLVILIMFVMSAIMFVQRIFDIILLYVISPASVATIPLDDGGRFRIWREMLVSKVLGAYGIILSMNLFFLIIPQVSQVSFFNDGFKDGIVQLLFVLGGAFSITKANMVIAQLTGNNAGAQEAQQMLANVSSGMRMARTAGHVAAGAAGMVIGGTDFLHNRRHGASFSENVSATIRSQRNRKEIGGDKDDPNKPSGGGSSGSDGTSASSTPTSGAAVKDTANKQGNGNAETGNKSGENIQSNPDNAQATNPIADNENNVDAAAKATENVTPDSTQVNGAQATETAAENKNSENSASLSETAEAQKQGATFGSVVKGTTRLATLPAGIMKDFIQGGVIVAGKNFIPRVMNVIKGHSIVNHADVAKINKENKKK